MGETKSTDRHHWNHQQVRQGLIVAIVSALTLGVGLVAVRFLTRDDQPREPPATQQEVTDQQEVSEPQSISVEGMGHSATGAGEQDAQGNSTEKEPATEGKPPQE
ncbi:MAG: hypothetical protein ACREF9_01090 [Opitutaceae bacterium]